MIRLVSAFYLFNSFCDKSVTRHLQSVENTIDICRHLIVCNQHLHVILLFSYYLSSDRNILLPMLHQLPLKFRLDKLTIRSFAYDPLGHLGNILIETKHCICFHECVCMDGWLTCDFTSFFNSISVISGRCMVDHESLCEMELRLRLRRFRLERGSNSAR